MNPTYSICTCFLIYIFWPVIQASPHLFYSARFQRLESNTSRVQPTKAHLSVSDTFHTDFSIFILMDFLFQMGKVWNWIWMFSSYGKAWKNTSLEKYFNWYINTGTFSISLSKNFPKNKGSRTVGSWVWKVGIIFKVLSQDIIQNS